MYEIDLASAISEINQACVGRSGSQSPFFFIVGAGISAPTVPIASEIEAECKAVALAHQRLDEPKSRNPIETYSHWFEHAYPQPAQRQRYLHDKIEGKPISPAVFRLAHLLLAGAAGKLVVTPNFDDFLSRALTLFGEPAILCDHPHTIGRISIDSPEVQIVHVHGTYWFYDCCNLKAEIAQRAENVATGPVTISSFFELLLWSRSPIVMGYSGWEGDVIMTGLQRRLRTPMPHNLYWFSYRRSELDTLPAWLRDSPHVRVIAPPVESLSSPREATRIPELGDEKRTLGAGQTLPAQRVLDLLVASFKLAPPPLTMDPLGFFAGQLRKSVFREGEGPEKDFYALKSVVDRVQAAAEWLARTEGARSEIDRALEDLRNAVRSSDYKKAIVIARSLPQENATRNQLEELLGAAQTAARNLALNATEELGDYQTACDVGERLMREGSLSARSAAAWANALVCKGVTLGRLGRDHDAISTLDEVVRRFGEMNEPAVRDQVAKALYNKGVTFQELARHDDAIAAYDEVVRKFSGAAESALRERVAWAFYNKGLSLSGISRHEDALAVYDQALQVFGEAPDAEVREQIGWTLLGKGSALEDLNRPGQAISVYDEVVRRFGGGADTSMREFVARALQCKNADLKILDQHDEAIAVSDDLVQRFGDVSELAIRQQVAVVLVSKIFSLTRLKRHEDALAVYDEVLRRYGADGDPQIQEEVAKAARLTKGMRENEGASA